jgi:hypothetical protein
VVNCVNNGLWFGTNGSKSSSRYHVRNDGLIGKILSPCLLPTQATFLSNISWSRSYDRELPLHDWPSAFWKQIFSFTLKKRSSLRQRWRSRYIYIQKLLIHYIGKGTYFLLCNLGILFLSIITACFASLLPNILFFLIFDWIIVACNASKFPPPRSKWNFSTALLGHFKLASEKHRNLRSRTSMLA